MADETNFDKISQNIMENFQLNESIVKEGYGKVRAVPLKEFHNQYELQKKQINQSNDLKEDKDPTMDFFIEAFEMLDQYPDNLKKAKPKISKESTLKQHLNTTNMSRSSSCSLLDITHLNTCGSCKETSKSLLNLTNEFEEFENLPSASDIYKDFQTFLKQLQELNDGSNTHNIEKSYITKLQSINKFARQLEKLMPVKNDIQLGVGNEDENHIKELLTEIENATIAQLCEFSLQQEPIYTINQSLQRMLKILSKCLKSFNV